MNRNEFIKILKEELSPILDRVSLNAKIDYYDMYITSEIAKGRSEKEVLSELGDPRLIAKTIKTVNKKNNNQNTDSNSSNNFDNYEEVQTGSNKTNNGNNWRSNKSGTFYTNLSNKQMIGCVIIFLFMFIMVVLILKFFGDLLFGTAAMMYGMGPFGLILFFLLMWLLFGRRRYW